MEFVRVSSFWELMMKPLSSVRYTSHLCMLTKIQNPSVTRITYSKGRRGRNEAFHPFIRPVIHPVIHPWMASYNNPL
jgi:hypothetical protein